MTHRIARSLRAAALLASVALAAGPALAQQGGADEGSGVAGVVNVNTAAPEELALLPGVGEVKASAIVDARRSRGGFESVDELGEVDGIGEVSLRRIRPFVAVEGESTLHAAE